MQNPSSQWYIPIILAAGAALALWYYWTKLEAPAPAEMPAAAPPPVETPEVLPGPLHPVEPVAGEAAERPELVPLPPLSEADAYLKLEVADIFGSAVEDMLADSGMVERLVATVDNLPRSHVAERIRPLGRLEDAFVVDGQDESGAFVIDTASYRRYDTLVDAVMAADLDAVVELYRRYYPLFQDAYVNLGYPQGYFNDRLVEVIDHLLATPDLGDPVPLVRPHVLYEFEDPDLEALSSGQKLLLRMGREHRDRIRSRLRDLKARVTAL